MGIGPSGRVEGVVERTKQLVLGMASKDVWCTRLSNSLAGALREYAKEELSKLPGVALQRPYSWGDEIARLVKKAESIYSPKTITSTKFNRPKALLRAVEEASNAQEYRRGKAFNYIEDRVVDEDSFRKVYKANFGKFDASELLISMLEEYSGQTLFLELQKAMK